MVFRNLPSWLYENMPYLYWGFGALTFAFIRNWMGMISGLLFLAVGALVFWMRRTHRRAARAKRKAANRVYAKGVVAGVEEPAHSLSWHGTYDCGNALIDRQHRELVGRANELVTALRAGSTHDDVELLLEEFLEKVARHFSTEESLAEAERRPGLPEHRELHRVLLGQARDIAERFHAGQRVQNEMVRFIVADLITGHVLRDDAAFTTCT